MAADEIKSMIPEIKQDLNYTVSLMENLLNGPKSQMESHSVKGANRKYAGPYHDVCACTAFAG